MIGRCRLGTMLTGVHAACRSEIRLWPRDPDPGSLFS
jgi:hypothetical protein